jgi:hypothetical protein
VFGLESREEVVSWVIRGIGLQSMCEGERAGLGLTDA